MTQIISDVPYTGNILNCPTSRIFASRSDNNVVLAQYGEYCYELKKGSSETWDSAESTCRLNGGHLVQIRNADEQNFITSFMARHYSQSGTWIGLYDKKNETNFEWTSGKINLLH